jgi:hypothetical protein
LYRIFGYLTFDWNDWLYFKRCYKITTSQWQIFLLPCFFPVALQSLKDPSHLTYTRFLELFRHMVGLLGRVISPSQGLYLHRTTQHRKTRDKHPSLERYSNPRSQQPTGQDPRLRPHGHCDRPLWPATVTGFLPPKLMKIIVKNVKIVWTHSTY